ncbi:MAG: NAD(P)H-hydrate dehydratase, partial [Micromonosporaceae bacterium]
SEPATRAADELAARVGDEPAARVGDEPAGRVAETLRLARALGAVVLRKGNRTIVATPQGGAYVNPTGSAALATAGTGDVLSGLIGSLLAAGVPAERAALAAAYAHGLAGRHSATEGPVTAQTVMHALRFAIAGLAPDHCGG